jgi:DNA-binding transcriptional ArsR family regulator
MTGDPTTAVFAALADPTRRELMETLARDGSRTASQLSATFPISRQAITKHLGLLSGAGLLVTNRVGREQRYELRPAAMNPAAAWMRDVGDAWDERLAALTHHLSRTV